MMADVLEENVILTRLFVLPLTEKAPPECGSSLDEPFPSR